MIFTRGKLDMITRRILAESENYKIVSEDECVTLIFKNSDREVKIGDFYGDPDGAFLDVHEKYCVMYGCGVIVYFLHNPFEEYLYDKNTEQWVEYGREPQNILWFENARQIDNNSFEIITENGNTEIIKIN